MAAKSGRTNRKMPTVKFASRVAVCSQSKSGLFNRLYIKSVPAINASQTASLKKPLIQNVAATAIRKMVQQISRMRFCARHNQEWMKQNKQKPAHKSMRHSWLPARPGSMRKPCWVGVAQSTAYQTTQAGKVSRSGTTSIHLICSCLC
jgi:hypothetical protein